MKTKKQRNPWNIGIAIVAAIIITLVGIGMWYPRQAATDVCHQSVKSKLKSPSTARFFDEHFSDDFIYGKVSAQNGFGATIDMTFTCEFEKGNRWPRVTVD